MPPKKAATLDHVYIITHQHLDTISEKYNTCEIIDIYTSLDVANIAAEAKFEDLTRDSESPVSKQSKNDDGGLKYHHEELDDKHEGFKLEVRKYEVNSSAPAAKSAAKAKPVKAPAKPKPKAAKLPSPEEDNNEDDEDVDDEEEEKEEEETAPPPKKAAPKKAAAAAKPAKDVDPRKTIPEGKPNALAGLKLIFTGTFSLDRNTCVATAEKYGATVIKKLEDTDYIILSNKAGPKKIEEIEAKGLDTLSESEFFELLKTGVSKEKRAAMAAKAASDEPPKKKQKK